MTPSQNPYRGLTAVRTLKALAVANGDLSAALGYARSQAWQNVRDVVESLELAAVSPIGTNDYSPPTPAAFDFAEFIRPLTIIGKLAGLRRVPLRTRMIAATSGSGAYWSGEKNPRPISRATFAGATLEQLSVVAMLVVTAELLRSSAPSAESVLSRDLAAAAVAAMDSAFIDPANGGTPGVKPASITAGVTPIHSAGSTLANIDSDLGLLIQALSDAGSDLTFATFVLRPRTALYLARLRGTGGDLAFPRMGVRGGELLGLPAITSTGVPLAGSNASISLIDPSEVLLADDSGGALEISSRTSLAMSDSPSAPSVMVSLFQTFSAALKTRRYVNWSRCRDGMAQVLDQVTY